ncbi:MAG: TadE family protein [Actinomycetota bacterium]|nr:TadE family protein [Actinomycetota bacterium]
MHTKEHWGQASLEMVLVMPMLFLVILAVSQLGHMVYVQNTIEQASREAARVMATSNDRDEARRRAEALCSDLGKGRLAVEIIPSAHKDVDIGDFVTVKVAYSYGGIANVIEKIWKKPVYIQSSSMMRMECINREGIYH